jgi:thymidylate synthase (FAD)
VTFTFEVKAPMFVFRQWHRHRTWSFSELSARYRELPEEFYVPDQENVGVQSKDNKQGRDIGVTTHSLAPVHISLFCEKAFRQYRQLLNEGVPRELARSVLPLATYSHMFATVDLLNLMKFWSLRSDPHAQYEIRVYSDAMRELVKPIVPVCVEAWEAGRNAA